MVHRDRDHENHDDDYYSPRRSRSKSRSISPRDESNCRSKGRSSRQSRPMSRSKSPRIQKKGRFSMSPSDKSQIAHDVDSAPRRLKSPGRNGDSSARSRSRSYRFVKTFVKLWIKMAVDWTHVLLIFWYSVTFVPPSYTHTPSLLRGSGGPLWKHNDAAARITPFWCRELVVELLPRLDIQFFDPCMFSWIRLKVAYCCWWRW